MLALHVLASGSSGNAAVIENTATGAGVLIDCGICKRDFLNRCDEAGFDPGRIQAMFVTHEHGDHVKGLGVVLRGLAKIGNVPPVFAAGACTANSSALAKVAEAFDVRELVAGPDAVEAAGMRIIPFATSHDAAASFGFRIEDAADGDAVGYLTDSGIVTAQAHAALRDVRILALESNHAPKMLAAGPYPYVIKQRIASARGHLSNDQAREALDNLAHENLRAVAAMHVSQENNTYRLPRETFEAVIAEHGLSTTVSVAFQNRLVTIG